MVLKLRGMSFNIRPKTNSDEGLVKGVVCDNQYMLTSADILGLGTVVDIGGHVGSFSILMSPYVKNIIAFEPAPDSYKLFMENISLNNRKNITLINKAVGSQSGILKFNLGKTAGRNTLCDVQYTHPINVIDVECVEINSIFKDFTINDPCLLKVDIEGEEYDLFQAITPESLAKVKVIVFEAHQYPDKTWSYFTIVDILQKKGYKISKVKPITVNPRILAVNIKAVKVDETK